MWEASAPVMADPAAAPPSGPPPPLELVPEVNGGDDGDVERKVEAPVEADGRSAAGDDEDGKMGELADDELPPGGLAADERPDYGMRDADDVSSDGSALPAAAPLPPPPPLEAVEGVGAEARRKQTVRVTFVDPAVGIQQQLLDPHNVGLLRTNAAIQDYVWWAHCPRWFFSQQFAWVSQLLAARIHFVQPCNFWRLRDGRVVHVLRVHCAVLIDRRTRRPVPWAPTAATFAYWRNAAKRLKDDEASPIEPSATLHVRVWRDEHTWRTRPGLFDVEREFPMSELVGAQMGRVNVQRAGRPDALNQCWTITEFQACVYSHPPPLRSRRQGSARAPTVGDRRRARSDEPDTWPALDQPPVNWDASALLRSPYKPLQECFWTGVDPWLQEARRLATALGVPLQLWPVCWTSDDTNFRRFSAFNGVEWRLAYHYSFALRVRT